MVRLLLLLSEVDFDLLFFLWLLRVVDLLEFSDTLCDDLLGSEIDVVGVVRPSRRDAAC